MAVHLRRLRSSAVDQELITDWNRAMASATLGVSVCIACVVLLTLAFFLSIGA